MKQNNTSTKLWLLLITFIVPVVISWVLFYYHEHFHFNTTNKGTLIDPPIPVGSFFQTKSAHPVWQIVFIPERCVKDDCQKMMFTLSQLKKALGKDYDRIALTLVSTHTISSSAKFDFEQLSLTEPQKFVLKKVFKKENAITNKIYLIDPVGNLFMYYQASVNPMDILKDLKHLLGVSQIG